MVILMVYDIFLCSSNIHHLYFFLQCFVCIIDGKYFIVDCILNFMISSFNMKINLRYFAYQINHGRVTFSLLLLFILRAHRFSFVPLIAYYVLSSYCLFLLLLLRTQPYILRFSLHFVLFFAHHFFLFSLAFNFLNSPFLSHLPFYLSADSNGAM
jgi:hypothetical protein